MNYEDMICDRCDSNLVEVAKNGRGRPFKRTKCATCQKKINGFITRAKNKKFNPEYKKKDHCEICMNHFLPHVLGEDHIDGDQTNDSIENFMTVCANCHSTKSHYERNMRFLAKYKKDLYLAQNELYALKKKFAKIEGIKISEVEIE